MDLTLGEKVRELREDAKLTQSQLATALNMTQRKVSYIECDKCEPSLQDIVAICQFFNVTADYLIGITK